MTETADRRALLADAAIETLARSGMRGLTHRAVDQAAGLPEGSCSNHFRTRQALLTAAVDRLAERDLDATIAPPTTDPDEIARAIADLAVQWITTEKVRMLARYELALEATRRPELRKTLTDAGSRIRRPAEQMFTALGASAPVAQAHAFVACLDGLVFDHLAGAGTLELSRDRLHDIVLTLLQAFTSPG
ncbi:TetR/AcrR family transcriptional regulator [Nocardia mexicana]|uniref:TetR family transcriptional regulator n=1 Tax=Nocardia mexicana TaxID=279262 RepID=A0A370H158_9NOCA|nr:TetR/AcrR family transcriptional regulator [Nocardia mexicana]RDI49769.1 TetR family transcriptional regulator [Nocardia mexicana]